MNEKSFSKFLLTGDIYTFFIPRIFFLTLFTIILLLNLALGFYIGSILILLGFSGFLFFSYATWSKTLLFNQPNSSTLFRDVKDTKLTRMLIVVVVILVITLILACIAGSYFACIGDVENCKEVTPWLYNIIY